MKNFYIVLFRIILLFSIIQLIIFIFPNMIHLSQFVQQQESFGRNSNGHFLFWSSLYSVITIVVLYLLFRFTPQIVSKFIGHLSEKFPFQNLAPNEVLKIGIILVGGMGVLQNFPALLSNTFWFLKKQISGSDHFQLSNPDWFVAYLIAFLCSLAMVIYHQQLAKWLAVEDE